ncbi:hypothetical protein SK128_008809 [Halocaridina rubra]|uniref:Ionotropic glutamate receptor L-glutamate and glycine-binding domain-containing protein n=1 Tax=Halocaridina rubra TaxID=373956 RepID=A0AAN9AB99_HALRR
MECTFASVFYRPHSGNGYNTILSSLWSRKNSIQSVSSGTSSEVSEALNPLFERSYCLFRLCPYCRDGGPEVVLADMWTKSKKFAKRVSLYPDVFENFHGHHFSIVTLEYAPFSCYEKTKGLEVKLKDCVDTRMVNAMSKSLNFTYQVREPTVPQWGYKLDNGSYTGVIGTVQKYEADFSLNVAFTGDREKVIDYTVGYFNDPLTFCTTKPRPLNQALTLLRPFQLWVWIGFFIVSLAMGPLYYLSCRVLPEPNFSSTGSRSKKSLSLAKAIMKIYGSLLSQSDPWNAGDGSRVLAAAWIIFSLVTMTSYVANLIASYTLPALSPTLNTLQELVDSDFSWGIQNLGAADYQLFKSSEVPLYQKVFAGLDMCPDLDECLKRARDTKYAFITWRLYMEDRIAIRFTSATGERQLHVAYEDFFPSEIGWAMNSGCPFRGKFNNVIRKLLESGIITKWLKDIILDPKRRDPVATVDIVPRLEGPQPLGLEQLQGIFYILGLGCVMSSIAFVMELGLHSLRVLD